MCSALLTPWSRPRQHWETRSAVTSAVDCVRERTQLAHWEILRSVFHIHNNCTNSHSSTSLAVIIKIDQITKRAWTYGNKYINLWQNCSWWWWRWTMIIFKGWIINTNYTRPCLILHAEGEKLGLEGGPPSWAVGKPGSRTVGQVQHPYLATPLRVAHRFASFFPTRLGWIRLRSCLEPHMFSLTAGRSQSQRPDRRDKQLFFSDPRRRPLYEELNSKLDLSWTTFTHRALLLVRCQIRKTPGDPGNEASFLYHGEQSGFLLLTPLKLDTSPFNIL